MQVKLAGKVQILVLYIFSHNWHLKGDCFAIKLCRGIISRECPAVEHARLYV